MSDKHPFPASLAEGRSFCNREMERTYLKHQILNNEHTVIVAPRRYGKTSLITQVITESEYPAISIDLLLATNSSFVNKAILDNVPSLLLQFMPKQKQAKQKLIDVLHKVHPKLTINILGQKLELSTTQSEERSIVEILLSLEHAAKETKKLAIVIFDEFQQVGEIKESQAIEAAIRHAVERSKHITYIFSGSHRHLLSRMFTDKSRPLYHLCEVMYLERIKHYDYKLFLTKHFFKKWPIKIDELIIDEILLLTGCHAFYVNALCRKLWNLSTCPTMADVQNTWDRYVKSQTPWIIDDLDQLSPNQINILAALAHQPTKEPLSSSFSNKILSSPSSIRISLNYLLKKDFVYRDSENYYRVLDPAIESYIKEIKYFDFIE